MKALTTLRIYSKSGDIYALAGSAKASCRAHVMADLLGVDKAPQSKSGVNAIRAEFYRQAGIDTNQTLRAQELDFFEFFETN